MRYVIRLAVLLCSVLAGFEVGPASAEKRVALVIGNGNYARIAGLPNVRNDVAAVADLLRAARFDSVDVKADLGVAELRRAVREFAGRTADADLAVVFYAGHGIEVDRTNYLIPVDARLASDFDVEDEAVSLDRVLQAMEPAKRLRLVILDACRENPFLTSMKRSGATRSVGRGLGRVETRISNTLVAFAAKAGALADDGKGPNSPFTAALVKHLATPGLDLRIAFGRVRDDVLRTTSNRQEPHLYGSAGGDTMSIFGAAPAAAPPVVQLPPSGEAAEAARICREVEGMSSLAMLQVLERQHKGKTAGECVAARIAEVRKLAMAAPPPAPAPPPAKPPAPAVVPPSPPPAFVPYHTRPVSLVVPFAPGGTTDVLARTVAEHMQRTLGQPVLVENRTGAAGSIGTQDVARAAADGYRILLNSDALAQSLATMGQGAGAATFEPVGLIQVTPMVLLSGKNVPATNLKDLVQWMRSGGRTFASAGVGSTSHLCGLHIEKTLGLTFVHVPYRGSAQGLQDVGAGVVDLSCEVPAAVAPLVAGGTVRAHAVLGGKRGNAIANVPTAMEAGVPGLEFFSHAGLYARKGTPRAAIAALNAALQKALADPAFVGKLSSFGVVPAEPHMRSPEAHAKFFAEDLERRTQLLRAAGVAR